MATRLRRLVCQNCYFPRSETQHLQVCAGCKLVYYCSRQCQKANWSSHQKDCKFIQKIGKKVELKSEDLTSTFIYRSTPPKSLTCQCIIPDFKKLAFLGSQELCGRCEAPLKGNTLGQTITMKCELQKDIQHEIIVDFCNFKCMKSWEKKIMKIVSSASTTIPLK